VSTITAIQPMTTPASPTPRPAFVLVEGGDQRTVFRGVDWHTYSQLSEAAGECGSIRLIYDGKDLEIMVIGNIHDYYKGLLIKIVNAVILGRDLDSVDCGQTTWRTLIRGLEADLSYYFDPEKIRVAREALARKSMDPVDYPRPDLAIEIDMSPPQVDRPAIYADLGVAEVWRLVRGQELIIETLQADGSYALVEESRFLNIRAEDVLRWLNEAATERPAAWHRRLNQWAMGLGRQA
jgi:Uma2 family endonuclease